MNQFDNVNVYPILSLYFDRFSVPAMIRCLLLYIIILLQQMIQVEINTINIKTFQAVLLSKT